MNMFFGYLKVIFKNNFFKREPNIPVKVCLVGELIKQKTEKHF